MIRSFLPVEPDEVRDLRPETTPPRPRSLLGRATLTVAVIIGLVGVITLFSLFSFGDACGGAQDGAWGSIQQHPALQRQEPGLPGCSRTFTTDAPAAEIIDYYASMLTAQGWSIVERDDPATMSAQPSAPPAGEPEPSADPAWSGALSATRDDVELSVVHDVGWATQQDGYGWELRGTVYMILSETGAR